MQNLTKRFWEAIKSRRVSGVAPVALLLVIAVVVGLVVAVSASQRKTNTQPKASGDECVNCAICGPLGQVQCKKDGMAEDAQCQVEGNACGGAKWCWRPSAEATSQCAGGGGGGGGGDNTNICGSGGKTSRGCYAVAVNGACAIGGGYSCVKTSEENGYAVCACSKGGVGCAGETTKPVGSQKCCPGTEKGYGGYCVKSVVPTGPGGRGGGSDPGEKCNSLSERACSGRTIDISCGRDKYCRVEAGTDRKCNCKSGGAGSGINP